MSKCKTDGCEKEAAENSEYCPACQCARDKTGKNVFKAVVGVLVVVGAAVLGIVRGRSQA